MVVAVVDGLGGGIGSQIVARLRRGLGTEVELIALGANATATERMVRAGANRGATEENAIVFTASKVDVVVGPIGIVIPNSMMGEITVAMANAIVNSPARKVLLPVEQPHLTVVGLEPGRLGERMEDLVGLLQQM